MLKNYKSFDTVRTSTELKFVCKKMWELPQTTILQIIPKIVGTHTFIEKKNRFNT